jgi:hypothetical protein
LIGPGRRSFRPGDEKDGGGNRVDLKRQLFENNVQEENDHPHGHPGVGNVKGRPMRLSHIKIEKINHLVKAQAIDHIAYRAAENQRQT